MADSVLRSDLASDARAETLGQNLSDRLGQAKEHLEQIMERQKNMSLEERNEYVLKQAVAVAAGAFTATP